MFCTQCGKKLVDNAKFCAYCGAKVELFEKNDLEQNKSNIIDEQFLNDIKGSIKNKFFYLSEFLDIIGTKSDPFFMPIEDVFTVTGRGPVATGRVERGILRLNDTVEIVGLTNEPRKAVVIGIEMFRKLLDEAVAGDNISIRFN